MAGCNDHELELICKLKNQFLQLLPADKLAVAFFGLEKKKISFISLLIVHITDITEGVFNSMSREMKTEGSLAEDFGEFFDCGLLTHD